MTTKDPFLRPSILKLLSDQELSAYLISHELKQSGSKVRRILKELERDGAVSFVWRSERRKRKFYSITDAGRRLLTALQVDLKMRLEAVM
jgi:DNA-binding PadR family transcriptional regulator